MADFVNEGSDRSRDRELGMHRNITRRDFLNGIAVGVGEPSPFHGWGYRSRRKSLQLQRKIGSATTLQRSMECGEVIPGLSKSHTHCATEPSGKKQGSLSTPARNTILSWLVAESVVWRQHIFVASKPALPLASLFWTITMILGATPREMSFILRGGCC